LYTLRLSSPLVLQCYLMIHFLPALSSFFVASKSTLSTEAVDTVGPNAFFLPPNTTTVRDCKNSTVIINDKQRWCLRYRWLRDGAWWHWRGCCIQTDKNGHCRNGTKELTGLYLVTNWQTAKSSYRRSMASDLHRDKVSIGTFTEHFCKKAQNCSTNCQINVDSRNNKRWTSRASHRSTCVVFGSTNLRGWARCVVASSLTVGLADCINAPQTDWLVRTRRWRYTVIRSH